jgi:ABC-type nitrate/sulfonate/bicarbonate transport system ATPase subunit
LPSPGTGLAIEVAGVSKSYVGGTAALPVLWDITLRVAPGEFVALLGPSGAGKSTLLNVIAGIESSDRGSIRVNGAALAGDPRSAYMQQKDLLLPWRTVWDNILLAPELRSKTDRQQAEHHARELLSAFHLDKFAQALPGTLSGGMRQRVALIRTLLCGRDILLLDEPFGALDAITRGRLQRHLLRVWRDYHKTVVLVTHDVEEALLLATRIVLLSASPGRVMAEIPLTEPHATRPESAALLAMKSDILKRLEGPDG